jgi:hypothetical protein
MKKLFSGAILSILRLSTRSLAICICSFGLMLSIGSEASAGTPKGINYQAVVRNTTGTLVSNQSVAMRFTIHSGSLGGAIVYRETHTVPTNAFGVITIVIGGGGIVQGNLDSIDWGAASTFLQVETDVTGGTNYIDMGTQQMMSVPYSFYSKSAGAITMVHDTSATVTGNDTIKITPTTSYLSIGSTVVPSSATVTLTDGHILGQCVVLMGTSATMLGVRLIDGGNLKIGSSGGPLELFGNSTLMLMWNGTQWVKMSYSNNQ